MMLSASLHGGAGPRGPGGRQPPWEMLERIVFLPPLPRYNIVAPLGIKTTTSLKISMGIRHLVVEYPTGFKLCQALRGKDPPLYVSDGIAKEWLRKFGGHGDLKYVNNAGHLEIQYGDRIRANAPREPAADALCSWLFREHSVCVSARVCRKWPNTDWSTSGQLLTPKLSKARWVIDCDLTSIDTSLQMRTRHSA